MALARAAIIPQARERREGDPKILSCNAMSALFYSNSRIHGPT